MKEDYKVTTSCRNCGHDRVLVTEKGTPRPKRFYCENCGCNSDTTCIRIG